MKYTGERFIPGQVEGDIKIEHTHRYQCITEYIKDKIVLDAACGDGYGTDIIADNALKAFGIDISQEAIDTAKNKYHKENLEFLNASVEKLPFEDSSMDVIVSFETIEHVNEKIQNRFLSEVKRVLKHDGLFIVSTPNKQVYSDLPGYKNEYHQKEFYVEEFKDFLKTYFMHVNMYSQSFERFNIIINIDNVTDNFHNNIIQDYNKNTLSTYVIAICSRTEMNPVKNIQSIIYCNQTFQSSLYLDFGNGFSEEHKVISVLQYNGVEFIVNFDLPNMKLVKALRWDPLEGVFCKIKLGKIILDNGTILVSSSNAAYKKEGFFVFTTMDPMYELEGEYHNATRIAFKGKMGFVSSVELNDIILNTIQTSNNIKTINEKLLLNLEQLKESHRTINEEKLRLQERLKISIEENKRLQEYSNMIIEDKAVLQSNYSNITKEMDKLQVNNNNVVEETVRLQDNYNIILEKLQKVQENYNIEISEKNKLQLDYNNICRENEIMLYKYKVNEAQSVTLQNSMRAETEKLKQTLDSILASKSWKMTKPFRKFKDFL